MKHSDPMSTETRDTIYIGKKPIMAYVTSTLIQLANLPSVRIKARGMSIGRAVDVAEVCRRRNGIIAQGLPEEVIIGEITCESEVIPSQDGRDRTVSVLRIELDGHGDLPEREEE